jgi:hypothetical protein
LEIAPITRINAQQRLLESGAQPSLNFQGVKHVISPGGRDRDRSRLRLARRTSTSGHPRTENILTKLEQAWQKYLDDCEEMRQMFLSQPVIQEYPALAANAHFILQQTQAMAYNMVMAPRQDSPCFYQHNYFEPLIYTGHQPNPDFPYRLAFLNGKRKWRVWGYRNSAHWVDIQANSGWWGEPGFSGLGNYDLDEFHIESDGSFEIIACQEPQPGNWIRLDADNVNNTLHIRPAMYDWDNEVPPSFHIEAIDDSASAPIIHDENEIIRRLDLAGELVKHSIGRWTTKGSTALVKKVGKNNFFSAWGDASRGSANPLASYAQAVYEIREDEALIIESGSPEAAYWSFSLGTWWWETTNHTHHKSSINGHQAMLDSDGKFRAVLAHSDPGVPNWLDPAGWGVGIILGRFYRPKHQPVVSTRVIPVAEVRNHLPPETGTVTPAERAAEVERRRKAVMRWYGY